MAAPASYILCGTPRTGSTLLCSLVSSTGVLGRPESYFREPDEERWANEFGLPVRGGRVLDHRAFAQSARAAGSTPNGVFAARVMWGSLDPLLRGLDEASDASDLAVMERHFGPLVFVHLRRDGLLEQAVSWCRAEQTGFWQDGDLASSPHLLNLDRLKNQVSEIKRHNAAWQAWFEGHGIEPLVVTYEEVVSDPRAAVTGIAERVSVELPTTWRPQLTHRRQADEVSAASVAALRLALESDGR